MQCHSSLKIKDYKRSVKTHFLFDRARFTVRYSELTESMHICQTSEHNNNLIDDIVRFLVDNGVDMSSSRILFFELAVSNTRIRISC